MGKYTELAQDLPKLPFEEQYDNPVHAQRVKEAKEQLGPMSVEDAISTYRDLRDAKDELEDLMSNIQMLLDAHQSIIEDKFEQTGVSSVKMKDGLLFSMNPDPIGGYEVTGETKAERDITRAESKEKFRQWCVDHGLGKSLQLWPSTMQSLVKERLGAGEPLPPGLVAYFKNKFQLRGR